LVIWDNCNNATIPVEPTLSLIQPMIAMVLFPLRSVTFPSCTQNHAHSLGIATKNAHFSTAMPAIYSDKTAYCSPTDSTRCTTSQLVKCVVVIGCIHLHGSLYVYMPLTLCCHSQTVLMSPERAKPVYRGVHI
jgi:hypothetical protein